MGNSGSAINVALETAFAGVQSDVTSALGTALPYALSIMGLIMAITIVVNVFRRFSKQK